jgi:tetratricopeptide (TPR) repeat protein
MAFSRELVFKWIGPTIGSNDREVEQVAKGAQGGSADREVAMVAAVRAGRHGDAIALAEAVLLGGNEHPLALDLVAFARQRQGRFDEAIALRQRRVRRWPRDPAAQAALADALMAARRPELALEAWTAALSLAPRQADLLSGKAQTLRTLGRTDAALGLYQQALGVEPASLTARFGLASMAVEAGDWDAAQRHASALAGADRPEFDWLAARIALGRDDADGALALASRLAGDGRLSAEQRAEALLLRSEALDRLRRPADAFAAAVEGKALQRRLFAKRAAGREGEIDKLNRLADWFRAADPAKWLDAPAETPCADAADVHVFLVGFPRSGTTLLEQVLAGNPRVIGLEEAPTLADAYDAFLSTAEGLARLASLTPAEADAWRAGYWAAVKAAGVDVRGRVFLDKAPAGTLYLPLVVKLFPRAKVLFALRDPRDVVLSCLRNNFQMNAMTYAFTSLPTTAACYAAAMDLAEVYRGILPLAMRDVRHETLVEDFEAELAAICAFLGLEALPAMADLARTTLGRTVLTPSADQVRAGLNRDGVGRWRAYAGELSPVLPTLAPWIARFGYAADGTAG